VSANGAPYVALGLMLLPSIPISYFCAYGSTFTQPNKGAGSRARTLPL
jgi:hypothetical protein